MKEYEWPLRVTELVACGQVGFCDLGSETAGSAGYHSIFLAYDWDYATGIAGKSSSSGLPPAIAAALPLIWSCGVPSGIALAASRRAI